MKKSMDGSCATNVLNYNGSDRCVLNLQSCAISIIKILMLVGKRYAQLSFRFAMLK